jgi:DNA-binding response OmpR family regulator
MGNILIIDDDIELCELLTDYLGQEGFDVETVNDGPLGALRALVGNHALIVLDVMLPGMNGFDVLRKIRTQSNIPVLMLTARGDDVDRIVGLEMGADDYLPKPFNPRELIARIRAIQRRAEPDQGGRHVIAKPSDNLVLGDVEIQIANQTVLCKAKQLEVTAVEFSLLKELLLNAGNVVPREQLAENVLGRKLTMFDRSIDVHISSLRKKLGRHIGSHDRIRSIRGVGYQYILPESS